MKQIFIENFRIDIARCEVHRGGTIVSLEPKVLQVFLYLAKHQGEVVTHQALLDEIWPNIVVEANALQRCIGQLRKAFADDAKQQRVIATFPKKGYSLLANVHLENPITKRPTTPYFTLKKVAAGLTVILLLVFLNFVFTSPSIKKDELLSISTTFDFYAIYSPNGRYVVYPRQSENGQGQHLWLQDILNNSETQLTARAGQYSQAAWAPNSNQIAFVENHCLHDNCTTPECSSLNHLSTNNLNANAPPLTTVLLKCQNSLFQSPQWINEKTIAYIRKEKTAHNIIGFDLDSAQESILFQESGTQPQHLTYSPAQEKLAISAIDNQSKQNILILETNTLDVVQLTLDNSELLPNERWLPIWNPPQNALLLSINDNIYTIELNGSITKQSSPFMPLTIPPTF